MDAADLFEALMLICFSTGWYWSIAKMLRTGRADGKSARFVAIISTGYACGVAAKLLLWRQTGTLNPLIFLYAWNLAVTFADLMLVMHLTRRTATRPV